MIWLTHKFNLSTGRCVRVDCLKENSALFSSTGWLLPGFSIEEDCSFWVESRLVLRCIFWNLVAHQLYRQQHRLLPQHSSLGCCRLVKQYPATLVTLSEVGKISQTVPSNCSDIVRRRQVYHPGGWDNKEGSRLNQARMNESCFRYRKVP
jgi:hypothetical protein